MLGEIHKHFVILKTNIKIKLYSSYKAVSEKEVKKKI